VGKCLVTPLVHYTKCRVLLIDASDGCIMLLHLYVRTSNVISRNLSIICERKRESLWN
jgi:hypothetical protein